MRNDKNHAGRCTKQTFSKHPGVCRTFSPLQLAYAQQLEEDLGIKEFRSNVPLQDFPLTDGSYTTDFLYTRSDGDMAVRECVYRKKLSLPRTGQLLDASRDYWLRHGITDWAIVIETEDSANAEE
ncbi:MAG: hypothetical protein E7470_00995 [Ruminococcaceae bacterium]|nr:hypothetical protein [Oscillospiraceae bacterium]